MQSVSSFDPVESWLDNVAYSHSESLSTRTAYLRHLKRFCKFTQLSPQQILEQYETSTDRAFKRKYAQLVKAWISSLLREGYTSSSITVMVGSIRSFFKYSDLPLGYIPMGKGHAVFHNRDITKEEIENIIGASNRARDRAFMAVMAQSGLRPHTLCLLRLRHVELNHDAPACIKVPEEIAKGKYRGHLTFIGPKALEYLRHYLHAHRRSLTATSYAFTQHGTEKKLDRRTMSHRFRDAVLRLKKNGLIEYSQKQKGKAGTIRLYSLRKFFRKFAGQAGSDYVQYWMGHVLKNQDEHYFPTDINDPNTIEHHRKIYMEKAMPHLRVEQTTPTQQEQIMQKQQEEIEALKKRLETLEPKQQFADKLFEVLGNDREKFEKFYKFLEEL